MNPFKLLLICSALALAGCGDKGDADKTADQTPVEQAQDLASQAADEAQQAASDAGAAMEQAAETVQEEAAAAAEQVDEAADAAAAGAAGMAEQAATAADETAAAAAAAGSAAVAEATGEAAPAAAAVDLAAGQKVYQGKCLACHATGAAGAPKMGDKADWAPRIAQGTDTLNKHAIEGFKGAKGYMPPKGGFTSLSDDEVKAAVAYMVKENS